MLYATIILSVHTSNHHFIQPSLHPTMHPLLHFSIHLSITLFFIIRTIHLFNDYPPIWIWICNYSTHLFLYLCIHLTLHHFLHPSVYSSSILSLIDLSIRPALHLIEPSSLPPPVLHSLSIFEWWQVYCLFSPFPLCFIHEFWIFFSFTFVCSSTTTNTNIWKNKSQYFWLPVSSSTSGVKSLSWWSYFITLIRAWTCLDSNWWWRL